jgi:hypothetical protein
MTPPVGRVSNDTRCEVFLRLLFSRPAGNCLPRRQFSHYERRGPVRGGWAPVVLRVFIESDDGGGCVEVAGRKSLEERRPGPQGKGGGKEKRRPSWGTKATLPARPGRVVHTSGHFRLRRCARSLLPARVSPRGPDPAPCVRMCPRAADWGDFLRYYQGPEPRSLLLGPGATRVS